MRVFRISNVSERQHSLYSSLSLNNSLHSADIPIDVHKQIIVATLRSRLKFAGVFLCLILCIIAGLALLSVPSELTQQPIASGDLQLSHTVSATDLISTPVIAANNISSNTADVSTPTTTTATSTSNNGGSSSTATNVTVNGHSLNVPANGTTQQVVNSPNGQTKVSITSNQTTNNNGDNSSVHQTDLHVSTSSTSSTVSEEETSP